MRCMGLHPAGRPEGRSADQEVACPRTVASKLR